MSKVLYLDVPAELGVLLMDDGFDEPYISRTGGSAVDSISAVLVVANTVISVGANTMTILVGTGQLQQLGRNVLAWLRRGRAGTEMSATIRANGKHLEFSLKASGNSDEADVQVLRDINRALSTWLEE
jgi:hypothetical protein